MSYLGIAVVLVPVLLIGVYNWTHTPPCPVCGVRHPSWQRVPPELLKKGIHHV